MCGPIAIGLAAVSAAATIAGTVAQSQAASQQAKAQDAAVSDQVKKQWEHQQNEQQQFADSLRQNQKGEVDANTQKADDARLQALQDQGGTGAVGDNNGSGVESSATKKAGKTISDKVVADATREAQGRAQLGGLDDAFRKVAIDTAPNVQRMALEQNMSQGDQNSLPLQLEDAQRAGSGMRTIGSLLTGVGGLAAKGAGAMGGGSALSDFGSGLTSGGGGSGSIFESTGANIGSSLGLNDNYGKIGSLGTFGFKSLSGNYK
jgi:hypothetical protein